MQYIGLQIKFSPSSLALVQSEPCSSLSLIHSGHTKFMQCMLWCACLGFIIIQDGRQLVSKSACNSLNKLFVEEDEVGEIFNVDSGMISLWDAGIVIGGVREGSESL